uniref:Uncharacterized protein n=1 Tax=Aegilops tauschii subsp. strangulata TaxID=200361 RepID=A0A453P0P6_AEGTS
LVHFQVQKQACDKFDPTFYPRFKKWCDDYFHIKHRGERRGVGGIFFDDLNDHDQETLLDFATECAASVIPAYIPIIERRKDTPFTEDHRAWQQLRRGRYVEFNLVSASTWPWSSCLLVLALLWFLTFCSLRRSTIVAPHLASKLEEGLRVSLFPSL